LNSTVFGKILNEIDEPTIILGYKLLRYLEIHRIAVLNFKNLSIKSQEHFAFQFDEMVYFWFNNISGRPSE
jgi:hypothetical protein